MLANQVSKQINYITRNPIGEGHITLQISLALCVLKSSWGTCNKAIILGVGSKPTPDTKLCGLSWLLISLQGSRRLKENTRLI